jgi:cobaltochelatase CobN
MRFLLVLGRVGYSVMLEEVLRELRGRGLSIDLSIYYSYKYHKRDEKRSPLELIRYSDVVLLSICNRSIGELARSYSNYVVPLTPYAAEFSKIPTNLDLIKVFNYWDNPSRENLRNLLVYLYNTLTGSGVPYDEPKVVPDVGFVDEELKFIERPVVTNRDAPLIAVLLYYPTTFEEVSILKMVKEFVNANYVIAYSRYGLYANALNRLIEAGIYPDLVLDFTYKGEPSFPEAAISTYKRLNTVVLRGLVMHADDVESWRVSPQGLNFFDLMFQVIMPEIEGVAEPLVIGGIGRLHRSEVLNGDLLSIVPVDDRVRRLGGRVNHWLSLRRRGNRDKRIAIIIYNYPPGEHNLGRASYLDVIESVKVILKALKAAGYAVDDPPSDLVKELIRGGIVNSPEYVPRLGGQRLSLEEYNKYLNSLPESVRAKVIKEWGSPPGGVMVDGDSLVIPGIILGNVFLGLQPTRGWHEDPGKVYHSKELPPHHQYLAFYYWIRDVFKADAVIHVGTHGTLEFTPGKEVGLGGECFPDTLIGDLPNIYIYNVSATPGEAMIAKRRSYAVLISHAVPPFTTAGLYEGYLDLERLLNEYEEARTYRQGARTEELGKLILEKARELHIEASDVEEVHVELTKLKRTLIPRGLHVFGTKWSFDDVVNYLTFILRYDREVPSLHRILARARSLDYDELLRRGNSALEDIENEVRELVRQYLSAGSVDLSKYPEHIRSDVLTILNYARKVGERILASDEIGGLLNALNGGYADIGPSDEPVFNPEVFPTGRNLHAFDPRTFPSDFAMKRAGDAVRLMVEKYLREHGKYPEKVAIDIFAAETIRTKGEPVAQILHLLGVRLRRKSLWQVELEPIPLNELGRPRIDVVVTISGVFRDMFPNLISLIDRAVKLVADLDEPEDMNYVKKHRKGRLRNAPTIFGPPPGEYGVEIAPLIETGAWKSEDELAKVYIFRMGYAYGEDIHGMEASNVLTEHLRITDVVTKIRDTHQFELMDIDDYYQFYGGLVRAVWYVSGKKPATYWTDTTREFVEVVDNRLAIRRGMITRMLNPKWINEMLKHGYSGALQVAERFDHTLGLQATTGDVEEWVWHELTRRYLMDREVRERIKKVNPWALKHIAEKLYEAYIRGYWRPSEEELSVIQDVASETEALIEGGYGE